MNLNKLTKAELISKFKKIDNKNSIRDANNITLVELILTLKNWILKLTIITLIIKWFKKYTFVSKILRFFNWIILSIFGISFMDNFNLSFIHNFISEITLIFSLITSYLTTTYFYSYLTSMWTGVKLTKDPQIYRWKPSNVYPPSELNETTFRESKRNSKIIEWLRDNEDSKKDDSNNSKYYILLLLLLLGAGSAWYYYGPDTNIPGWGFITGSLEAFRNTINLMRDANRAGRDTTEAARHANATAKKTFKSATEFLRNKDNKDFSTESKDLLNSIKLFHNMPANSLNSSDVKTRWESYKIVEARIAQLEQKFPDEFKNWMDDTNSSVYTTINNFWNIGPTISRITDLHYPDIANETLIQQKAWSDHTMSPAMVELSMDQAYPPAPPAPPVTQQGEPSGTNALLESIRKGKSLKPTNTIVKDKSTTGSVLGDKTPVASSSNNQIDNTTPKTLTQSLSAKFDILRKAVRGDSDEEELDDNKNKIWEEIYKAKEIDKGKGRVITAEMEFNKPYNRTKYQETPYIESDNLLPSEEESLDQLDLTPKLLNKLIDFNNEVEVINEISNIKPDRLISKIKTFNLPDRVITLNVDTNIKRIINENPGLNKQQIIEILISENSQHKDRILEVVSSSLNTQISDLENKFNAEQTEKLHKTIRKEDLNELQSLKGKASIDQIKTVVSINRTHSSILKEIKERKYNSLDPNNKLEDTMNLFE